MSRQFFRRIISVIMAFVLAFGILPDYLGSARAEDKDNALINEYPESPRAVSADRELLVGYPEWDEQNSCFRFSEDQLNKDIGGVPVKQDVVICFAIRTGETITPVPAKDHWKLGYNEYGENKTVSPYTYEKNNETVEADGLFTVHLYDWNEYEFVYNDEGNEFNDSVRLFSDLPEVGLYREDRVDFNCLYGVEAEFDDYTRQFYINGYNVNDPEWGRNIKIDSVDVLYNDKGNDISLDSVISVTSLDDSRKLLEIPEGFDVTNEFFAKVCYTRSGYHFEDEKGRVDEVEENYEVWLRFFIDPEAKLVVGETDWDEFGNAVFAPYKMDGYRAYVRPLFNDMVALGVKRNGKITPVPASDTDKLFMFDNYGIEVPGAINPFYDNEGNAVDGVFFINPPQTGIYDIDYTDGDDKMFIFVEANTPEIAVYEKDGEGFVLLGREAEYTTEKRTFYIKTDSFEDEYSKRLVEIESWNIDPYLSDRVEIEKEDGALKLTVAEDVKSRLHIDVGFVIKNLWKDEESEWHQDNPENRNEWFEFYYDGPKLMLGWPDWQQEGPVFDADHLQDDFSLDAKMHPTVLIGYWDGNGNNAVPLDRIGYFKVYDGAESIPECVYVHYEGEEQRTADGIFELNLPHTGKYKIVYTDADGIDYDIVVYAGFPEFGLYSASEISNESFLGTGADYKDVKTYYLIFNNEGNDTYVRKLELESYEIYSHTPQEYWDGKLVIEEQEQPGVYRLTLDEDVNEDFNLRVRYTRTEKRRNNPDDEWFEETWNQDMWFEFENSAPRLLLGWPEWDENGPRFIEERLEGSTGMSAKMLNTLMVATQNGDEILAVPVVRTEFIKVYDSENVEIQGFSPEIIRLGEQELTRDGIFSIVLPATGEYTVVYTDAQGTEYKAILSAGFPEAGLYSAPEISEAAYLGSEADYKDCRTFYIVLDSIKEEDHEKLIGFERYEVSSEMDEAYWDGRLSITATETEGVYKLEISEDVSVDFNIRLEYTLSEKWREGDDWREEGIRYGDTWFNFTNSAPKLVIGWPEYGLDGKPYIRPENMKSNLYLDDGSEARFILALKDNKGYTPLPLDKVGSIEVYYVEGGKADKVDSFTIGDYYNSVDDEYDCYADGLFKSDFYGLGLYTITYTDGDDLYSCTVTANVPRVSAFTEGNISPETYIGMHVSYDRNNRTYYILPVNEYGTGYKNECSILDYEIEPDYYEGYWDDKVTITDYEDGKKVEIAPDFYGRFSLRFHVNCVNEWEDNGRPRHDEWEEDRWIDFNTEDFPESSGWITDGKTPCGYTGYYVPEEWFMHPEIAFYEDYALGHVMYVVHGKTVQDVIRLLGEAAKSEAGCTGYVACEDGTMKETESFVLEDTGYILIEVSQFGNMEMQPQYVASSGNLKGIMFTDVVNPYNVVPDAIYKQVTGADGTTGKYRQLKVSNPDFLKNWLSETGKLKPAQETLLNAIYNAGDGVIYYNGRFYRAKCNNNTYENRELGEIKDKYFTFASDEDIGIEMSEEEFGKYDIEEAVKMRMEDNYEYFRFEHINGLHVNLYCDVDICGEVGRLTVGYPDLSLTGNDYHKVWIPRANLELNGPADFPGYTKVDGFDSEIMTYSINSDIEITGNAKRIRTIVPEPNSLFELTYEQKDAVEAGKKLKVTFKADDLNPENELGADEKAAVEAINEVTFVDATTVEYWNFTLSAKVEGVEGTTNINKTSVPIFITYTPETDNGDEAFVRLMRYHDGKVEFLEKLDSLYGENSGINIGYVYNEDHSITFTADEFSIYALEISDGHALNNIGFTDLTEESDEYSVVLEGIGDGMTACGLFAFTVSSETACYAAISYDGGRTYERLVAVKASPSVEVQGDTYCFIASVYKDVMIAVGYVGDTNLDGVLTAGDGMLVLRYKAGLKELSALGMFAADADYDNEVTQEDGNLILNADAGLAEMAW